MFAPFLRHSSDCVAPREPQEIVTWFLVVVNEESVVRVGFKSGGYLNVAESANTTQNQIEFQTKRVAQAVNLSD